MPIAYGEESRSGNMIVGLPRTGTIHLIRAALSATMSLLRVRTEISWSHSTIRGNVYPGTSQ